MKFSIKYLNPKNLSTWIGVIILLIDIILWIKNAWEVNELTLAGALILTGMAILGGLFLFGKIKTIDGIANSAKDKYLK